jgi:hypothetical protein
MVPGIPVKRSLQSNGPPLRPLSKRAVAEMDSYHHIITLLTL